MEQGYMLNKKMIIPPYSENLMEFPTNERGNRFIERQILQPGLICANGITKCDKTFTCLVINLTADAQIIKKIPELVKTAHSNKEKKMKLHNTWVMLKMLIPFWLGKLTDAQEVKALDSKTGVTKNHLRVITDYCDKIKGEKWYHLTDCGSLNHFVKTKSQKEIEGISLANEQIRISLRELQNLITPHTYSYKQYLKEAPLDFDCCFDMDKTNDYEKLQLDMPLSNLMSSVDDLRMASMKADDLERENLSVCFSLLLRSQLIASKNTWGKKSNTHK
ncbi:hypothetical protein L9F63_019700, partial [Diploptera punctata]